MSLRKISVLKIKKLFYFRHRKTVVIQTDSGLPLCLTVDELKSILSALDK